MKKLLLILILGQLTCLVAKAQNKSKFRPSARLKCYYLSAPREQSKEDFTLPFSQIEVADARHDSSKLGFYRMKGVYETQQYCTKKSVQQELQDHLNRYYKNNLDSNSANRLLICIKKLWITDFDKAELLNNQREQLFEHLYYNADIYYQVGDNYYPVQRLDSIFNKKRSGPVGKWDFIERALQYTMDQIRQTDFTAMTKKRFAGRQRIDSFYNSFALPILKDTSYKKGVYATFDDFKNNRPVYDSFELKPGKLSDILYVQESDGKTYVKRDAWGFSDGKNLYVRMGLNFFPIFRINQTWEFYGTNVIGDKTAWTGLLGSMPLAYILATEASRAASGETPMALRNLRPFHIDMETGEIF